MEKKPLYYYLFKPDLIKLPIFEKYNPIKFLNYNKKNFSKKFSI